MLLICILCYLWVNVTWFLLATFQSNVFTIPLCLAKQFLKFGTASQFPWNISPTSQTSRRLSNKLQELEARKNTNGCAQSFKINKEHCITHQQAPHMQMWAYTIGLETTKMMRSCQEFECQHIFLRIYTRSRMSKFTEGNVTKHGTTHCALGVCNTVYKICNFHFCVNSSFKPLWASAK